MVHAADEGRGILASDGDPFVVILGSVQERKSVLAPGWQAHEQTKEVEP